MNNNYVAALSFRIGADTQQFLSGMQQLSAGMTQMGSKLQSVGKSLSIGITAPLTLAGGAALKMAADFEQAEVAFTTMLGSADKAGALLNDIKQFAASTPFQFPELQQSSKSLLAFGESAENIVPVLRRIGDVSAGIGAPISEIAEIYGKARVQGRLFAEDINQLTGRGIPIIGELAKQFGVAESAIKKMVEDGQVDFKNLEQAFINLTSEGGKFAGLMEAQSNTLGGIFSTLKDTATFALVEIGNEIVKAFDLKNVLKDAIEFSSSVVEGFKALSPEVKQSIILFTGAAAAIGPLLGAVGTLARFLPLLGTGFTALTGPIGLTVAAIAGAATLIVTNWDKIKAYFTTGPGAETFSSLASKANEVFFKIKTTIESFVGLATNIWEKWGDSLIEIGKFAFNTLGNVFSVGLSVLSTIFDAFSKLMQGDFSGLWEGLKNGLKSTLNTLIDYFTGFVTGIRGIGAEILKGFGFDETAKGILDFNKKIEAFGEGLKFEVPKTAGSALGFFKELLKGVTEEAKKTEDQVKATATAVSGLAGGSPVSVGAALASPAQSPVPAMLTPQGVGTGESEGGLGSLVGEIDTEALDELKKKVQDIKPVVDATKSAFGAFGASFSQSMNQGIKSVQAFGRAVIGAIKQAISAFIAKGIAGIVSTTLGSAPGPIGIALAAAAGGAAAALFNSIIPKFAEGGIIRSPTLGIIGERGPEAVVPLNNRGADFMRNIGGGQDINLKGEFLLDGNDLRLAVERSTDRFNMNT